MDDILELLDGSEQEESSASVQLRRKAFELLQTTQPNPSNLVNTIYHLLNDVFKPLFSKSQHPGITSTGRKNLVSQSNLPNRFGNDSIFDPPPPWKNNWTVPLLSWILSCYNNPAILTKEPRQTIEAHFHLLVPPLLHLIDDVEISYKASGCTRLTDLCTVLTNAQSDILKRTGLAEVFIDALKNCFHYLPTLTPEEESLRLLTALYPAYLLLVRARFVAIEPYIQIATTTTISDPQPNPQDRAETNAASATATSNPTKTQRTPMKPQPALSLKQISTELALRRNYLSTLLRHSLLHSISHLSISSGANDGNGGTTISAPLTTFLLTQIPPILSQMRIDAHAHLQSIVPMLTGMMQDPFVPGVAPEMLSAAVDALEGLVLVCWTRIRERWWVECLKGLVGAWLGCRDEIEGIGIRTGTRDGIEKEEKLRALMGRVQTVVTLIADVVGGKEFYDGVGRLVEEESELRELFDTIETT